MASLSHGLWLNTWLLGSSREGGKSLRTYKTGVQGLKLFENRLKLGSDQGVLVVLVHFAQSFEILRQCLRKVREATPNSVQ